jgi:hypothetical protein
MQAASRGFGQGTCVCPDRISEGRLLLHSVGQMEDRVVINIPTTLSGFERAPDDPAYRAEDRTLPPVEKGSKQLLPQSLVPTLNKRECGTSSKIRQQLIIVRR